jgi:hypothetical protein
MMGMQTIMLLVGLQVLTANQAKDQTHKRQLSTSTSSIGIPKPQTRQMPIANYERTSMPRSQDTTTTSRPIYTSMDGALAFIFAGMYTQWLYSYCYANRRIDSHTENPSDKQSPATSTISHTRLASRKA